MSISKNADRVSAVAHSGIKLANVLYHTVKVTENCFYKTENYNHTVPIKGSLNKDYNIYYHSRRQYGCAVVKYGWGLSCGMMQKTPYEW